MGNRIASIIVVAALALFSPFSSAGREFIRFHTGNSEISYDGINEIFQDSRGFVWIGTFKGLNRYDGTRFRVWCREDLGLSSDFIHQIAEDRDGNLWIGTDAGVTCYLTDEDRFEPLLLAADNGTRITGKVTYLSCGDDGLIRILAGFDGCFIYDPQNKTLVNYLRGAGKEAACSFRKLLRDPDGGYWLSKYRRNLYHADAAFSNRHAIELGDNSSWFAGDDVEGLFYACGDSSRFYAISTLHGISEVCPSQRTVRSLFPLPKGVALNDVFLEEGHRFWLSTSRGAWAYDLLSGETLVYEKKEGDPFSLSDDQVRTVCVDRNGGLWVGTKDGGVHYSGLDQSRFIKVYDKDLRGAIVSGFTTDGQDRVWVTTEKNGLFCYTLSSGVLTAVNTGLHTALSSPCYLNGSLWIGSQDGLYRYDVARKSLRFYGNLRNKGVDDGKVYVVMKAGEDDLYACTTRGVFHYDAESDRFESLDEFYGYFITSIAEDKDGRLWLSTFDDGVFQWDPVEQTLLGHYCVAGGGGLASDKVCSVYIDTSGNIWAVGFSSGFYRLDRAADRFVRICKNTLSVLPTNVFFRALESESGDLYLSSDSGLVRYVPETGEVDIYTELDGLLQRKFTNSALRLENGEMFFGSDNGFIRFHPAGNLREKSVRPVALITKFRVGDKSVANFNPSRKQVLKADQNIITCEFAVLGSSFPATERLQCRLDRYDKGWRDVSARKRMTWFNLPPGNYRLRLRTAEVGGEWEEKEEALEIVVKPTFWGSPVGVALIVLLSLLALSVVLLLAFWQTRRKRLADEERFRKAKEEEMFHQKLDFFSHVIHEIKTPLTLIRTPLSQMRSRGGHDAASEHDLSVMQRSTDYLTSLVNELLDFVRIERKGYELHPVELDLADKLQMLVLSFSDTAAERSISISLDPPAFRAGVSADVAALDKILNNILINAVKYAESRITIAVTRDDENVRVTFSNDGPEIPEAYREAIFRPFVQYHQESGEISEGVGIGLPLARMLAQMHGGDLVLDDKPGETCFVLTLPRSADEFGDLPSEEAEDAGMTDDQRPSLLLVEDNRELTAYLAHALEERYAIQTAGSVDAAMAIVKEQPVDMVLTDISMPGKSGLDLCREIRDDIEISHIPIIVVSARTSTQSKVEAMRLGVDLFIEKPFDMEYLLASIHNILSRRGLMRRALSRGMISQDIAVFGLPRREEEFLLQLDKVIMDHLSDNDVSNEFLADHLAVSQSTLVRKVRRLLGTSPNNYVRNKRLAVAEAMMRESSGNNVSDICYAVGFTNLSYFAKCFREQYGKTPSEYMDSLQV